MEVSPSSIVLLECRRRDGVPTLRRARVVARSTSLIGLQMVGRSLADLEIDARSRVAISAPGRPGSIDAAVVELDDDGLVVVGRSVVVPLHERRAHRRTLVGIEVVWPGGSATTVDVSPGGLSIVVTDPPPPGHVSLVLPGGSVGVVARPIGDGARLRFAEPVPALDADRLVTALTLGR